MSTPSNFLSINIKETLQGLLFTSLSQPFLIILTSFSAGKFQINWTEQWHLAVAAGSTYLIQKFFSGPKGTTSIDSPKQ